MTRPPSGSRHRKFPKALKSLFREAVQTSYTLFKIIVPVSIAAKILIEVGAASYLGTALEPVMGLVGLPGSMGLVWATTLITNLYGGIVVFASLAPTENLTVANVTVLTSMMLVAHALPVELTIARKSGARLLPLFALRILTAVTIGTIQNLIFSSTGWLSAPSNAIWQPEAVDPSWSTWALDTAVNLLYLFIIILVLMALMKVLEAIGFTRLLIKILAPVLGVIGIGRTAIPITIIGITLGISYGGGLIIREAASGRLNKHDVFFSLALMSVCHSLIEDTLLMSLIGGHLVGILLIRLVATVGVIWLLHRCTRLLSNSAFDRFLYREPYREPVSK